MQCRFEAAAMLRAKADELEESDDYDSVVIILNDTKTEYAHLFYSGFTDPDKGVSHLLNLIGFHEQMRPKLN